MQIKLVLTLRVAINMTKSICMSKSGLCRGKQWVVTSLSPCIFCICERRRGAVVMADPATVKLRALSVVQAGILRKGIAEILVFASGDCYCVCLAFASFQCCKHRVVLSFLSVHHSQCTSASIHSKYNQESLWTSSFLLG